MSDPDHDKRPYAPPRVEGLPAPVQPPAPRRRFPVLPVLITGLAGAQLVLPEQIKPLRLAGEGAADFYGRLMDESNRKDLELAQQQQIARRIAELQTEYANWRGVCALTMLADPELGRLCYQGAEEYYRNALAQIRRSRVHVKP